MINFVDELDVGCERKRGVKDGYKCSNASKRWMVLLLTTNKWKTLSGKQTGGNSKFSIRNAGAHAMKAIDEVPSGNTLLGVITLIYRSYSMPWGWRDHW